MMNHSPAQHLHCSRDELLHRWDTSLAAAPALGPALLSRWSEAHRDYHGPIHLAHGLAVLDHLGGGTLEQVAWWFHDAVHHNDTPWDEQASAALAREWLTGVLGPDEVNQVCRLVLLTINHDPEPGDLAGQRLCDADLAMIALDESGYADQVQRLRNERPDMDQPTWNLARIRFTGRMLSREHIFHTSWARHHLEATARANLARERDSLLSGTSPPLVWHPPQPWLDPTDHEDTA